MLILAIFVATALGGSFLCSLLEATLLSSRVAELEQRKAEGDSAAQRLLDLKSNRIDDAISAILILNTVAHTVGAAGSGAQAARVFGSAHEGYFVAALTLAVLVFTEIIPKTLGTVHASRLVGFTARTLTVLIWCMTPLLLVTRLLTGLLASEEKPSISRGELAAMVAMATREGTLQADSSRVVSNVLRYPEIRVEDIMTPRTVIAMLPIDATVDTMLDSEQCRAFSRIPLYEGSRDHVRGYILQREALAASARGQGGETRLQGFLRKPLVIPEGIPLDRALRRLTEGQDHLALVMDEYGGLSGLVTLEDLTETILGIEILDESDRVADLRLEAAKLRDRRLKTLARNQQQAQADHRSEYHGSATGDGDSSPETHQS